MPVVFIHAGTLLYGIHIMVLAGIIIIHMETMHITATEITMIIKKEIFLNDAVLHEEILPAATDATVMVIRVEILNMPMMVVKMEEE
jgi:hypothetical protein